MSKKYKIAEEIGAATGKLVYSYGVDLGVFICSRNGAMGMFAAGRKELFKEDYLDFLRESIKRIQQVIEETENGNLDLTDDSHNKFIFKSEQGKFISFEEDEAQDRDEWEFPQ